MKIKLKPRPASTPIVSPEKKYGVILADPPWTFKVWSDAGEGRSASQHYPLLDNKTILALPVHKLAAEDCALFLWVTMPLLEVGLDCIKSWGFKYKTCAFTWCKTLKNCEGWFMGNGYWTRANAELCLLGTRGKPKRVDASVRQLVCYPQTEHSAKPPDIRRRIDKLIGDVPKIELFARERDYMWDSTGLDLDGKDIRDVLK